MPASAFEQELATAKGVRLLCNANPVPSMAMARSSEVEFEYTESGPDGLTGTGETFRIPADQLLLAIGQTLDGSPDGLNLDGGKIAVTGAGRTSRAGVWAGGDCASGGDELTVTAVAEGRDAAEDIHT